MNSEILLGIFEVQAHYRVGSTGRPTLFLSRTTRFSVHIFVDIVVFL